jgi:hypothetical protein
MASNLLAHEGVDVVDDMSHPADRLRRLYLARFAFAIAWAASFAFGASTINPFSATLLVLYPTFDIAAAVVDYRSSRSTHHRRLLLLNMSLSLLTAIGLALAAASGTPNVLRVWGAWAITAGLVQLVVAMLRRRLGGQWPLILSGAISTLAGAGFVLGAAGTEPSLTGLAGYAALGGIFFLASALRLHRAARASSR